MTILNLTIHPATAEQLADGVVDIPLSEPAHAAIRRLLDFSQAPSLDELARRARDIASIAAGLAIYMDPIPDRAMIGSGHPSLIPRLELALAQAGLRPVYAFSRRESIEERQADGSVAKRAVFRHVGFVEPFAPPVGEVFAELERSGER